MKRLDSGFRWNDKLKPKGTFSATRYTDLSCLHSGLDELNIQKELLAVHSFLTAPQCCGRRSSSGNLPEGPGFGIVCTSLIEETEERAQLPCGIEPWDGPVVEIQHLAVLIMFGATLGVHECESQLDGIKGRHRQRA